MEYWAVFIFTLQSTFSFYPLFSKDLVLGLEEGNTSHIVNQVSRSEGIEMDLTRVFGGTGGFADPNATTVATSYDSLSAFRNSAQPAQPPNQAFRNAHDAAVALQREAHGYEDKANKVFQQIQQLQRAVAFAKEGYDALVRERDQFNSLLVQAEGRLNEVQRVVQRYTVVQEPVVASDGFTYERRVIKQYLDECQRSGVAPISQQTQQELNATLIPNQSLKKLVELLKGARPSETSTANVAAAAKSAATAEAAAAQQRNSTNNVAKANDTPVSAPGGSDQRLHPCVRVYGYCNYKESCTYAQYPYDACLSHLKGKCRFGSQCHELHVDFKGPSGVQQYQQRK
jgi:hypothetical protein